MSLGRPSTAGFGISPLFAFSLPAQNLDTIVTGYFLHIALPNSAPLAPLYLPDLAMPALPGHLKSC